MRPVFVARLICSDQECTEVFEARAATLAELEALACDCGCSLEVVGWADWLDGPEPGAAAYELRPAA
jgi:hypothetical protein